MRRDLKAHLGIGEACLPCSIAGQQAHTAQYKHGVYPQRRRRHTKTISYSRIIHGFQRLLKGNYEVSSPHISGILVLLFISLFIIIVVVVVIGGGGGGGVDVSATIQYFTFGPGY